MRMLRGLLASWLLGLALAACGPAPLPATPALWAVRDDAGHEGWLFGTIHSAPAPLEWRSDTIDGALTKAGAIMVEVGNLQDDAAVAATFARLARGENEPPLSTRASPDDRAALKALMDKAGYADGQFREVETWAAALTLARSSKDGSDAANGVDRAVLKAAGARPVLELEGAETQLGIFDALPEREQRDLLGAVAHEATSQDGTDLLKGWRAGDIMALEAETRRGLLADPELREALFTERNAAWTGKIAKAVRKGQRPFVAVGAAHMVGPDGLIALLEHAGLTVERLQ
ncbi:TraB/GumN family protein [Novosphingobium profundi]|uniref:TraB/GumN family protein n=1 Tax=Novosphingobium profundi TaxID=1774954 RepID=UPI001CFE1E94|nr:TraB/GumN family protein [Novosphingobium profundi]